MSWWTGATHGTRVGKYIFNSTLGAWKRFTTAPDPEAALLADNVLLSWSDTNEKVQGLGVTATVGVDTPSGSNRINIHGHVHAARLVAPILEGDLDGNIDGNAATATKLQASRSIAINGAVTGSVVFDGSSNVTITTAVNHNHSIITPGTGISGSAYDGSTARTWSVAYGAAAGTACEGNDARLSDARPASGGTATSANKVRNINFHADTVDPTGTSRLNMDGDFHATRIYNAVWNDIVDFIDTKEELSSVEFGRVYCRTRNGHHHIATEYMPSGILGLASDTYGFGVGHKSSIDSTQLPIAIGGVVLAYVDQEYETGIPLTATEGGGLTEMRTADRAIHPERIVATYYRPELNAEWNGLTVDGRHWVKIR